jgi:hypothetical protein
MSSWSMLSTQPQERWSLSRSYSKFRFFTPIPTLSPLFFCIAPPSLSLPSRSALLCSALPPLLPLVLPDIPLSSSSSLSLPSSLPPSLCQILEKELVEYQSLRSKYLHLLTSLQTEIRLSVVFEIQAWWATHLLRRKFQKIEERRDHSRYYFRIRRLAKMKRAVDHWQGAGVGAGAGSSGQQHQGRGQGGEQGQREGQRVGQREGQRQSLEELEFEYCDVLKELAEYRLEKSKRIQKIVRKFIEKLRAKYLKNSTGNLLRVGSPLLFLCLHCLSLTSSPPPPLSLSPPPLPPLCSALLCFALLSPQMRTKERKRLERLISYEMVRKKEKILTETLRQQIQEQTRKLVTRTWMCDRFECKRRVFFSEQRLVSCLHSSGVGTGAGGGDD